MACTSDRSRQGVREGLVVTKHAFRNACIVITILGFQFGQLRRSGGDGDRVRVAGVVSLTVDAIGTRTSPWSSARCCCSR